MIFVGTSGYSYAPWVGRFYPRGTSAKKMLAFYATKFAAVESNYTFRNEPSGATLAAWCDQTPETFRFALKAPMRITHIKRLVGARADLTKFARLAAKLGERLGPILVQCPPNLVFDEKKLARFLRELPRGFRWAFDFRHPSWAAARAQILDAGHAWCLEDTDEHRVEEPLEGELGYLRLRRSNYTRAELAKWAERVREFGEKRDVFVFFAHEDEAKGPRCAAALMKIIAR